MSTLCPRWGDLAWCQPDLPVLTVAVLAVAVINASARVAELGARDTEAATR